MIELLNVTKSYEQGRRTVTAVAGVSLTVEGGEYVTIMGPSGSGKSTLMHLMGALDTPTTGRAVFQGRDMQTMSDRERSLLRRTKIGFVFQAFNLRCRCCSMASAGGSRCRRRSPVWSASGWITGATTTPKRCPAGRCSASRWRGRSSPSRTP